MRRRLALGAAVWLAGSGGAAAKCAFDLARAPRAADLRIVAVKVVAEKKAAPGCVLEVDEGSLRGLTLEPATRVYSDEEETCKTKVGETIRLALRAPCCDPGGVECKEDVPHTGRRLDAAAVKTLRKAAEDRRNATADADVAQLADALLELSLAGPAAKSASALVKEALKRATTKKGPATLSTAAQGDLRGAAALALLRIEPESARRLPQLHAWSIGALAQGHVDWSVLRSVSERRRDAVKIVKEIDPYLQGGHDQARLACMTAALLRDAGRAALPGLTARLEGAAADKAVVPDCARAACAVASAKDLEKLALTTWERRAYRCDPLVLDVPFVVEAPAAGDAAAVRAEAKQLEAKQAARAAALAALVGDAPPTKNPGAKEPFKP